MADRTGSRPSSESCRAVCGAEPLYQRTFASSSDTSMERYRGGSCQAIFGNCSPPLAGMAPEGHLARFVVEMVEQLDLRELEEGYRGSGKAAYHPSVLLSNGYATGVFSSRKQASYDSVAFRFITGNTHPDHDTIAHFRKRFVKEVEGMFVPKRDAAQYPGNLSTGG